MRTLQYTFATHSTIAVAFINSPNHCGCHRNLRNHHLCFCDLRDHHNRLRTSQEHRGWLCNSHDQGNSLCNLWNPCNCLSNLEDHPNRFCVSWEHCSCLGATLATIAIACATHRMIAIAFHDSQDLCDHFRTLQEQSAAALSSRACWMQFVALGGRCRKSQVLEDIAEGGH